MKKLWFLFLIIVSFSAIGQPSVKIYAYSQVITPGTIPKGVTDENGKPVNTQKKAAVNYYIFAAYKSPAKIDFDEIWINGKFYKTRTENIDSTPVVNINENIPGNPVKEVLVPATNLKVTSIIPVKTMNDAIIRTSWFRNMTKHVELIVIYTYHGKKYFIGIKKIKVLQFVAGV
jgi:hypothetical protein